MHRGWNAVVEGVLTDAIAAGEVRRDLDPAAGARAVTSFVMGAMLQLGVNARSFSFEAVAAELAAWLTPPGRVSRRG